MHEHPLIGWREWLALPQLGLTALKAKVDTGARSSSLHVDSIREYERDGQTWLRFAVATRRRGSALVECEAPALDRRDVTDSGGHVTSRWFIRTQVCLGGVEWIAEINLTNRCNMLFPMLLGRSALSGRFRVDPSVSYACGRLRASARKLSLNPGKATK
jgi:hypothetical protein